VQATTAIEPLSAAPVAVPPAPEPTLFSAEDFRAFHDGSHGDLHEKFGAHAMTVGGVEGTYFAVWAPNAARVSVIGDFNNWHRDGHPMRCIAGEGIWETFIPHVKPGAYYKYHVVSKYNNYQMDKADPFAFRHEVPPRTASVVWGLEHSWSDDTWMKQRRQAQALDRPVAIYECHIGSWRRVPEEGHRWLTYREIAHQLSDYVKQMGYTHVEFLPVMEHPFYGSWGYQPTGYFAPTSRYGMPQDFMYLVDHLHQEGIGVIVDWVPLHFPTDAHGLVYFDGTHLYEHPDARRGFHLEWKSAIFNFDRREIWSFLLSSALYWLEKYHVDGLRVDAVSFMIYLDYCRRPGQWLPNKHGGRENLEAIEFLRRLNEEIDRRCPGVLTMAEESTEHPNVSRPRSEHGLGFHLKWDMGWMHDSLVYMGRQFNARHDLNKITFRMLYAFRENFVLSLSHDEVVHLKKSLLDKMPGNWWDKFAGLRLLLGWMYAQPGKKLMFMGGEFGQWREWSHDHSLDWHLAEQPTHAGIQKLVTDLNHLYRQEPALHERDCHHEGFEWVDCHDRQNCVVSFLRKGYSTDDLILVVCSFLPGVRRNYRIGVPRGGLWQEVLNSDAAQYGGSNHGNNGGFPADARGCHGRPFSLNLTIPPLAVMFFKNIAEKVAVQPAAAADTMAQP